MGLVGWLVGVISHCITHWTKRVLSLEAIMSIMSLDPALVELTDPVSFKRLFLAHASHASLLLGRFQYSQWYFGGQKQMCFAAKTNCYRVPAEFILMLTGMFRGFGENYRVFKATISQNQTFWYRSSLQTEHLGWIETWASSQGLLHCHHHSAGKGKHWWPASHPK